jgi:hypothetical protein
VCIGTKAALIHDVVGKFICRLWSLIKENILILKSGNKFPDYILFLSLS